MFEGETIMMSWKLLDFYFFFRYFDERCYNSESVFMYLSEIS